MAAPNSSVEVQAVEAETAALAAVEVDVVVAAALVQS